MASLANHRNNTEYKGLRIIEMDEGAHTGEYYIPCPKNGWYYLHNDGQWKNGTGVYPEGTTEEQMEFYCFLMGQPFESVNGTVGWYKTIDEAKEAIDLNDGLFTNVPEPDDSDFKDEAHDND